jgi:hypothetical protein
MDSVFNMEPNLKSEYLKDVLKFRAIQKVSPIGGRKVKSRLNKLNTIEKIQKPWENPLKTKSKK